MIVRAGVAKPENIAMPSRGKDERGASRDPIGRVPRFLGTSKPASGPNRVYWPRQSCGDQDPPKPSASQHRDCFYSLTAHGLALLTGGLPDDYISAA